jgi:D-alanyl-D-alanine carboxypeptidase
MLKAARDAGLTVLLSGTYRDYATQNYLFNNKVAQYGGDEEIAASIVARPGTSEHQTGLAADIVDRYYEFLDESLAATELSKWLYENSAAYGFILRYPQGKQDITGIMFEPWHYRYVGVEAARYIREHELCLEEFLALYEGGA